MNKIIASINWEYAGSLLVAAMLGGIVCYAWGYSQGTKDLSPGTCVMSKKDLETRVGSQKVVAPFTACVTVQRWPI